MVKVYREVGISVGMGEYPTNFTTAVIDVMTENDIAKLLVEFPPRYDSYRKIVDIGYITSSQVYTVMTYEMTYDDELEKFFFYINRRFTYGNIVYLQFRCLYEDGQESVDPAILRLKFRPALRTEDFESYENNDLQSQSEILEKLVIQHANVNASTIFTGHVRVDGTTIVITSSGVISAIMPTPPPIPVPLSLQIDVLGIVTIIPSESTNALCTSSPLGGTSPYIYDWYFEEESVHITTQNASNIFGGSLFNLDAALVVTDSDGYKIFGGASMVLNTDPTPTIPSIDADFKAWITATVGWEDNLEVNLESTIIGGTSPYEYEWYLGTSIVPIYTPNAQIGFAVSQLSDINNIRIRLIVSDADGREISTRLSLTYAGA
jgi:hypothetical protein